MVKVIRECNAKEISMENQIVKQEQGAKWLDTVYKQAVKGVGIGNTSVVSMAQDYMIKHKSKEEACKAMLKNQVIKCTSSGIITGIGGIVSLPFTLPVNVSTVLYMQMRMIACTAYMAGYEPSSDQTETLVLACLINVPITQLVKQVGVKASTKVATNVIKSVPGKALTKINQLIGFRFITKFGSKGVINLGKAVPFGGAGVGGAVDFFETRTIAKRAYDFFFEN